jgi:cell division protein FtsW
MKESEVHRKRNLDPILQGIIFTFGLFGLAILYSASNIPAERDFQSQYFFLQRQVIWLLVSLTIYFILTQMDFRILEGMGIYLCIFTILLLILVFVPGLGKSVGTYYGRNFNRWIGIGPFQVQPSEFAKITTVVYLAGFLSEINPRKDFPKTKLLLPGFLIGSILLLIVLEPSFGTTMELVFLIIAFIFLSGFSFSKLFISLLSLFPLVYLLVDRVGYRRKRLDIWLDPYSYRYEEGHQLVSSFQAFRSGSWFGNEISSGYSHKYLPYSYTDFIASTFVEDYGFFGFLIFWTLILFFIFRGFVLLEKIKDPFGLYLGSGILILLSIQFLMNLFVITGILPVTGVSLPFLSYGGSSLLSIFILCGILVNITSQENMES